jgi:hypothetical protein
MKKTESELRSAREELKTLDAARTALRRSHQPTRLIEQEMQRVRSRISSLRSQWSMA